MVLVETPYYSLEPIEGRRWTAAQEKSIAVDYPFDLHQEAVDQFVNRQYMQFLWLPQSIAPLQLFVPSLRRVVDFPSSSQAPHSLHALLDPLLRTTREITNKYHVELVQILHDGGGAGEIEETMMWYALHNEKKDDGEAHGENRVENQGFWSDETWRQEWLERLERREVQIQILLYMTKLSLPGPTPSAPQRKKRKRSRSEAQIPTVIPEDRLESFMDKLAMLQLTSHLATGGPQLNHHEKDWAQSFCEDIVESLFKSLLPELCSLLRSKVFPNSPFSDTDTATASRSPSPEPQVHAQESLVIPLTNPVPKVASRPLLRARSRSLSVSLAQEKEERERSISVGPGKKRPLNREVSMSRGFKPKLKAIPKATKTSLEPDGVANDKSQNGKLEVILVEDTPQKPRTANRNVSQSQFNSTSSSNNIFGIHQNAQTLFGTRTNETDDDDAWMLDSSPDVLVLRPGRNVGEGDDDEYETVELHTPSKRPRR